jgi:LPS-assembly lipoprotein
MLRRGLNSSGSIGFPEAVMSRIKFIVAIIAALLIGGCGFTPVYTPGSQTAVAMSNIAIAEPQTKQDYILVRHLEERLGRTPGADRLLNYDIWIYEEGYYMTPRFQLVGQVDYQLVDAATGEHLITGTVKNFTGFTSTESLENVVRRDAEERLLVILADDIVSELMIKQAQPSS